MTDCMYILLFIGGYSGGQGAGDQNPPPQPGKSQVAIGFLRNSGTDPLEKQLDPMGPIASKGRSVRPSKNCDDDYENNVFRTH